MYEQFVHGVEQRQQNLSPASRFFITKSASERHRVAAFWLEQQNVMGVLDIIMTVVGLGSLIFGLLALLFFAGVFKGGLSYYLLGLALVRLQLVGLDERINFLPGGNRAGTGCHLRRPRE